MTAQQIRAVIADFAEAAARAVAAGFDLIELHGRTVI
jgi:2,4-dienoyl-CoA reductase-like NADH-dependent reductase (Old Yellow Enzyme family)